MPESADKKSFRKERVGIVLSNKMTKTIVVQIRRKARHPEYGKVVEIAKKFKVHDEKSQAKPGDRVRIVETRPLSKEKRWRLVEILSHGHLDLKSEIDRPEQPRLEPQAYRVSVDP